MNSRHKMESSSNESLDEVEMETDDNENSNDGGGTSFATQQSETSQDSDEDLAQNERFADLIRKGIGSEEIEKALKVKGIDLNYQNAKGNSHSHVAIRTRRASVFDLLMKNGANETIQNKKFKTCVDSVIEGLRKSPDDPNLQRIKNTLMSKHSDTQRNDMDEEDNLSDSESNTNAFSQTAVSDGESEEGSEEDLEADSEKDSERIYISSDSDSDSDSDSETYAASGAKRGLHGTIYQLKVIMLFVKEAEAKYNDFRVATEMNAFEKFDDLVFQYKKALQRLLRLVQVKHTKNPHKNPISLKDLESKSWKNPYSLLKYFISICKIMQNKHFVGSEIEEYLIVTNTDFKESGYFESDRELQGDDILGSICGESGALKYKFSVNYITQLRKMLMTNIVATASDLIGRIKDQLATFVSTMNSASTSNSPKNTSNTSTNTAQIFFDDSNYARHIHAIKQKIDAIVMLQLENEIAETSQAFINIRNECKSAAERRANVLEQIQKLHAELVGMNLDWNNLNEAREQLVKSSNMRELNNAIKNISKAAEVLNAQVPSLNATQQQLDAIENAVQTISIELNGGKRRKTSVLNEAKRILSLLEPIANGEEWMSFKNTIDDLSKSPVNRSQRDTDELNGAIETVSDEIRKLAVNVGDNQIPAKLDRLKNGNILDKANTILVEKASIFLSLANRSSMNGNCENLEKAYDNLQKVFVQIKNNDHSRSNQLNDAYDKVLSEGEKILKNMRENVNLATQLLNAYKNENSAEFKRLQEGKLMLNSKIIHLRDLKQKISNSIDLKDVKNEIDIEIANGIIPKTIFSEYEKNKIAINDLKYKLIEHLEKLLSNISILCVALNDDTFEKCFTEFTKKFRIITRFPNEEDLGVLVKRDLGEKFHLLNANLINGFFEHEIMDFFKDYENGRAKYYSSKKANAFMSAAQGYICTLVNTGLNKHYIDELNAYDIRYQETFVKNRIVSTQKAQIHHICSDCTRLSAVKMLQTLSAFDLYERMYMKKNEAKNASGICFDSYIFTDLKSLLQKGRQEYLLSTFRRDQVIFIECQQNYRNEIKEKKLYTKISKLLTKGSIKKVILIAGSQDTFVKRFRCSEIEIECDCCELSFSKLDENSQGKVLERKIILQGRTICLNQIINKNFACQIIDRKDLYTILTNEVIVVGNEESFSSNGYDKDFYVARLLSRQWVKTNILNEQSARFFVTKADEQDLHFMGIERDQISIWNEKLDLNDIRTKNIILPPNQFDSQGHVKIFKNLGPNVYWLEYQPEKKVFVNRKAHFREEALKKYIETTDIQENFFCQTDEFDEKVIIIANNPGVGKSTVLTSMATSMQGLFWVVRVDLLKYDNSDSSLNLKQFNFGYDEAIDFVTKIAVPQIANSNGSFQENLFRASLNHTNVWEGKQYQKPKIVVQFDGFDEICPNLKIKSIKLIKALTQSDAKQIWITTRFHEKTFLENELKSLAYVLRPWSLNDRIKFSCKFGRWNLKFYKNPFDGSVCKRDDSDIRERLTKIASSARSIKSMMWGFPYQIYEILRKELKGDDLLTRIDNLQFSDYIEHIFDKLLNSIKNGRQFTKTPLNIRMLTEVIFNGDINLENDFGIFDLYSSMMDINKDIFIKLKVKPTTRATHAVEKQYQKLQDYQIALATRLFLAPHHFIKLNQNVDISDADKTDIAAVGIMSLDGDDLEFTHHSIAEFLFSKFLMDNLEREEVRSHMFEVILAQQKHKLVRTFLNGRLKELPNFDLTNSLRKLKIQSLKNILQAICGEGHHMILHFVLANIHDNELFKRVLSMINLDDVFDRNLGINANNRSIFDLLITICKDYALLHGFTPKTINVSRKV